MVFSDERLAAAALELSEAILAGLPEPEECRVEFSAWFEKKMKRVLRRGNHPVAYRVMQRAASIVLVLFLGLAAVMAMSPTVRASVFGWIKEQYESFIKYEFPDRPAAGVQNAEYYIAGLDADYEVTYDNGAKDIRFVVYQNSKGEELYFKYLDQYDAGAMYIEEKGYLVQAVSINGNPGDVYTNEVEKESNSIAWCDRETGVMFYIAGYVDAEELIALAESVCRKGEEPVVEKPADYVLTGLPEGYTEYMENDAPDIYTILYANAEGKPLYFVYSRDPNAANVFLKAEGNVVEEASVHGMDADVYLSIDPEHSSTIIWCDGSTQTMFYISACMDKEELIILAESVRRADGYLLTGLPDGSEVVEVSENAKNYFSVYFNAEGQIFYFSYGIADGSGAFAVGTEGYEIESVTVNGYQGDLYMGQDPAKNNSIIWGSEDEKLIFYISGPFDRDTLIAMAESVERIE